MPLSQSVTLMVVLLRFNATHQPDTVGAQQREERKFRVHRFVAKNQSAALEKENLTPKKVLIQYLIFLAPSTIGSVDGTRLGAKTIILQKGLSHMFPLVDALENDTAAC